LPARTTPKPKPVTNADLAASIEELGSDLRVRLDKVEKTVKEAGLNGHTDLLKSFLEQYAATYTQRQAWLTVRQDIAHRFRWLQPGRHWLGVLLAGILGALGWEIVSHLAGVHHNIPFGL
jgi:hypothetical protein